jgi:alpha-1,2-glucosyltransferase
MRQPDPLTRRLHRYFSAGFLLLALHLPRPSQLQATLTLLTYAAINAMTLRLFLTRTWTWFDGSVARFMW